MTWISPRIWRSADSRFNDDEPLQAAQVYTPEVLSDIAEQGFDGVWLRGRLGQLMRSEIYPELNDPQAARRIANLRQLIARGQACGVRLHLFFNEPLSLPRTHDFWKDHPELAGESHVEPDFDWDERAFCTSTPEFGSFFDESVGNLFDDLTGLGGVILITASEYHSHCWSHRSRRKMGDKYLDACLVPVQCPNCRDREPADIVAELVGTWKNHADRVSPSPRVWAWNWSWAMWYEQPQREVIDKLPSGVELMCDFERGGTRQQDIGAVAIDEYSLGYPGPSERFLFSRAAAGEKGTPVCAKLQIGTTHELATVPNLPLIPNLFDKLSAIDSMNLNGLMCSWNFGNSASLNTAAFRLFVERSDLRADRASFLTALAGEYFGPVDPAAVIDAWDSFCAAFAQYPFSIKMLYHGPMNYAVAYPLTLEYHDRPMGPAWVGHDPWGDRLEDCIEPFTLEQVCQCCVAMEALWKQGLTSYAGALSNADDQHQFEELSCARMIGCHLSALRNIFEFHAHRRGRMQELGLSGPCCLPGDDETTKLIERQRQTCQGALDIIGRDRRFGYHQEPHAHFYDETTIAQAIDLSAPR